MVDLLGEILWQRESNGVREINLFGTAQFPNFAPVPQTRGAQTIAFQLHIPDGFNLATVRNGTVLRAHGWHHRCMGPKNTKKESAGAVRARVRKEMLKPRMSRSAKIAELNLDLARIRERSSITMPGSVSKILAPRRPHHTEKAQIALTGAARPYRDFRIENALVNEYGDDVKLKKGARVDVTVATKDD
jgi:hypothetical protein